MFVEKPVIEKKTLKQKVKELLHKFREETDINRIDNLLKPMIILVLFNSIYEMLIMLSTQFTIIFEFAYWRLIIKIFNFIIIIYFIKLKRDEQVRYT